MIKTSLNGTCKLKYYDFMAFQIEEIKQETFYPADWMETCVPEDVRTVLRRNGYISGYYLEKDLDAERWIEEKDWVYYRDFYVDKELEGKENVLCFAGIDTLAVVWVNGVRVGECHNMFLEQRFDVTNLLHYGEDNWFVVQVLSPIGATRQMSREGIYPQEDTTRMLLRKSQMNWGWDFCGHCLTTGIWKEVYLRSRDCATLQSAELTTQKISEQDAVLRLRCRVEEYDGQQADAVRITLKEEIGTVWEKELTLTEAQETFLKVEKPRLWWPRPYGEPFLYDVSVALLEKGRLLDEKKFRFGIRTVELVQEKDEGGRSFLFSVNGKRLFIRGANWVPMNAVYAEMRDEEYDRYFKRILDSNLTMLRVWGGGIYESEHFLDLCDEHGILLFWDMMFACGIYPQDEAFLEEVYRETKAIVKANCSRTCIAVWSADNELDEAYRWYDKLPEFKENKVNRVAIRKAVEETDDSRPFLVSSPCSPFEEEAGGEDPNSDKQGDMHLYLTRFMKEDEYYYKKILEWKPRFMSEYGFSSLPSQPGFSRFNFYRKKLDLVRNPWLAQLDWLRQAGEEAAVEEVIYDTQFTHAQGLKYWIEYLRSLKWHCGGSLYWKYNDPVAPNREDMLFPSMMSCIDFYHVPKLAYYYAKRAYEDVILAFREDTDRNLYVVGCNETDNSYRGTLTVEVKEYDGTLLFQESVECTINEDTAQELFLLKKEQLAQYESARTYVSAAFCAGDFCCRNLFHLTEIGDWNTVKTGKALLQARVTENTKKRLTVWLQAGSFVQDVMLEMEDPDVCYSDNGFWMEAGEQRSVEIQRSLNAPSGCLERLRIRAWNAEPIVLKTGGSQSRNGNNTGDSEEKQYEAGSAL